MRLTNFAGQVQEVQEEVHSFDKENLSIGEQRVCIWDSTNEACGPGGPGGGPYLECVYTSINWRHQPNNIVQGDSPFEVKGTRGF